VRQILLKCEEAASRVEVVAVILTLIASIIVTFAQVFGRYVLNYAPASLEELARYLFIWLIFMGAPIGVRGRGHMAIMLVSNRLSSSWRRRSSLLIYLVAAIFLVILAWQGVLIMVHTGSQVSPTMEISMRWVYAAIPTGSILMLLHLGISFLKMGISEHPLFAFEG
jgi:TRAP-type C4-dicarboxylate transport system permease small subunit